METNLLQLSDENLTDVEIDAGDESAEQPLGAQNSELSATAAIEQSAAILETGSTPDKAEDV